MGKIHHIEGTMTANIYTLIMENCMRPSADALFPPRRRVQKFTFQQDNDPKHTAIHTTEYFEDYQIDLLPWPAYSPDLNPIENLWAYLDKKLIFRKVNNARELFAILEEGWKNIPIEVLNELVDSMPRRCQAVIYAKGQRTKY